MRIAVFTGNPAIDTTPWWGVLLETPGLSAILIVEHRPPHDWRTILRSVRRNVRKHGWIFLPYRIGLAVGALLAKPFATARQAPAVRSRRRSGTVPMTRVSAADIHAPDVIESVTQWKPDFGLSLGAPILKPDLFTVPRGGVLNVHLGKVPDFRGAPPAFWELWTDAGEVGATIHWVNEGLDTGAVVECATAPIYPDDTLARVEARVEELGARLLAVALRRVANGDAAGIPQPPGGRTHRFPTLAQRFALWRRITARRLRARLATPWTAAKYVAAACWLAAIRPVRDAARTILGRHPVRVFTFHRVTDLCRDGMTVRPAMFRRQVEYVSRHHQIVDLDHALHVLATPGRLSRPLAVITFDDGYRSVADAASPALDAAGATATCFVCPDLIDADQPPGHDRESPVVRHLELMDWHELRGLVSRGWRIGGHTATHARLSDLSGDMLRREVGVPLSALRSRLGVTRATMAYPFGGPRDITAEGAEVARQAGYAALFSNFGGENFRGDRPFILRRIDLGGDHETLMWKVAARGLDLNGWKRRVRPGAQA